MLIIDPSLGRTHAHLRIPLHQMRARRRDTGSHESGKRVSNMPEMRLETARTIDLRAEHSKRGGCRRTTMRERQHLLRKFHSLRTSAV